MRFMSYAACLGLGMLTPAVLAQPAADLCVNAPTIGAGSYLVEIDANDGHDGNFPSCSRKSGSTFFADRDVWLKYVPTFTGQIVIGLDNCDQTEPGYNRGFSLSVWSACGGPEGGEIEDSCQRNGCGELINMQVIQGQTYLMRIAAYPQSLGGVIHEGYTTLNIVETPPPANDTCANAQEVGVGAFRFDDRSASFHGPLPSCSNTPDQLAQGDVFYAFTSPATATTYVRYDFVGGVVISVLDGSCTGTELACDPPAGGSGDSNAVTFNAVAGQRYIIRIAADANTFVSPDKNFSILQTVSNDTCETASPIVGAGTRNFSFAYAQTGFDEPYPSCGVAQNSNQRDVWFVYTAQTTGMASIRDRFSIHTPPASGANLTKSVHSGCSSGAGQIACSTGRVCFPIVAGQNYWIRCAGTETYSSYAIDVAEYPVVAGDSCATAATVNVGTNAWTNAGVCDRDPLETAPICGYAGSTDHVWFAFTPSTTGYYSFSIRGTTWDTIMQLYTGCGSGATPIACNDNIYTNDGHRESYIDSTLINAGSTVYVRVSIGDNYYDFVSGQLIITNEAEQIGDNAQTMTGNGALTQITGSIDYYTVAKVYKIRICDYANFSAMTAAEYPNTSLFLFDSEGYGVAFNDDTNLLTYPGVGSLLTNLFVNENGEYYLAVTGGADIYTTDKGRMPVSNGQLMWEAEPRRIEREPDGNGSGGRFSGWTGIGFIGLPNQFTVTLTGACLIEPSCPADFNNDNTRDVADLFAYINAWLAKTASADFNGDSAVDVADLFAYINAWLAGC